MTCISVGTARPIRPFQPSLLCGVMLALGACGSDSNSLGVRAALTGFTAQPGVASDDADVLIDDGVAFAELPIAVRSGVIGDVLVSGSDDLTLYTYADDAPGQSTCYGSCAATWPPISASEESETGEFSTVFRRDDSLQWSFKDRPLYYYAGDGAAGEVNGEGLGDVWFVARPDPVATRPTSLGTVLVGSGRILAGSDHPALRSDLDGRTLYVFANDAANLSYCNEGCASNWPPLYADRGAEGSSDYSIIVRNDGTTQWAYRAQPLYFFAGDSAAGDTLGEGAGGTWNVALP